MRGQQTIGRPASIRAAPPADGVGSEVSVVYPEGRGGSGGVTGALGE